MSSLLEQMRESYNKGRRKALGQIEYPTDEGDYEESRFKTKVKPLEGNMKKKKKNKAVKSRFFRGSGVKGKYKGIF